MKPAKLGRFRPQGLPFRPLLWNAFRPCVCQAPVFSDTASDTDTIETSLFDTSSLRGEDHHDADGPNNIGAAASESNVDETEIVNLPHDNIQSDNHRPRVPLGVVPHNPDTAGATSYPVPSGDTPPGILGVTPITDLHPVVSNDTPRDTNTLGATEVPGSHFVPPDESSQHTNILATAATATCPPHGEESGSISRLDLCFNCRNATQSPGISTNTEDNLNRIELNADQTRAGVNTNDSSTDFDGSTSLVAQSGADGACDAEVPLSPCDSTGESPASGPDSSLRLYQCARCNKRFINNVPPLPLTLLYNSSDSRNASWNSRNFGSFRRPTNSQMSSSSNSLASWSSNVNDSFMETANILRSDSSQGVLGASSTENTTPLNGLLFNFARQFQHNREGRRWGLLGGLRHGSSNHSSRGNSRNNSLRNDNSVGESNLELLRMGTYQVPTEQRQWYFYDPRLTNGNRGQRLTLETDFGGVHNEMSVPGIISPPPYEETETLPTGTVPTEINWAIEPPSEYPEIEPPPPYIDDPPPSYYSRTNSIRSSVGASHLESDSSSNIENNNDSESIISDIILENWAMLPQANDVADGAGEVIQSFLDELRAYDPPENDAETCALAQGAETNCDHENIAEHIGASVPKNVSNQTDESVVPSNNGNVGGIGNNGLNHTGSVHEARADPTNERSPNAAANYDPETISVSSNDSVQSNLLLHTEPSNLGWPGISGVTALDPDQLHFGPTFRMGMRPPIRWNRGRDVNRWTSSQGWLPQI